MADFDEQVHEHRARNRKLVEVIQRKGGDLDLQRTIDLHFWAPDKSSAEALSAALHEVGSSEVAVDLTDSSWSVDARFPATIKQIVSDHVVERLVALAMEHRSVFDGWGTAL